MLRILEDDPLFNAGRGAILGRDGAAELDASIMDGATLRCGGCGTCADDALAAVSCTGHGERIIQLTLARHAADLVGRGRPPAEAAREAIEALRTQHAPWRQSGRGMPPAHSGDTPCRVVLSP